MMKLKLIFFFLFTLNISLSAQTGNCIVFSPEGEYFYIALDNKFQNAEAHKNIRLLDIPEGDYWVTIMFFDKEKKAIKTNMKLRANREISYQLTNEGNVWRVIEYSNIPKNQAKTLSSNQLVVNYNNTGVEVRGIKSADKMPESMVHTTSEPVRVKGDPNDKDGVYTGGVHTDKRQGNFKYTEKTEAPAVEQPKPQPEPETGTFTTAEYIQVENADGTTKIIEEKVTTVKEIVERNGQKFVRSRNNKAQYDTDFTCLPMKKEPFLALKETVAAADNKLEAAKEGVANQCMTPGQIKAIGDLIGDKNERNLFAIEAKKVCASPNTFPYEIEEPVVVAETPVEEVVTEVVTEVEEVKEEPKPKTKAELKAELKAAKAREKAEKIAAKAKAKAEKKAAKEAAKAKKLAEKAAKKK